MKAYNHSARKPGHDWHGHTRGEIQDLKRIQRERNQPTTTGVLHFDANGNKVGSPTYQPRTWGQIAALLPHTHS